MAQASGFQGISLTSQLKATHLLPYDDEDDIQTRSRTQKSGFLPSVPPQTRRNLGKNIVLCWYKGEPLFTLGPHAWIFLMTWLFLQLLGIFTYLQMDRLHISSLKLPVAIVIIWEGFIYLLTALMNPGIVSTQDLCEPDLDLDETIDPRGLCKKCSIIRTPGTLHCKHCDVCVKGYDHHCHWLGKCIGQGNICAFYTFLASTPIYMLALICILADSPYLKRFKD